MLGNQNNINDFVLGGILGASLGACIADDQEEGAVFGALLGAAIAATASAHEKSKKIDIAQLVEEDGALYEITNTGEKRFFKTLNKTKVRLPEKFKLS